MLSMKMIPYSKYRNNLKYRLLFHVAFPGVTRTRIQVTGINFDQGKQNLVHVIGESELSEFELTKLKWLKSGVKSKGNWT